jgi:23S rRNA (cytosine1962-C5)-methyltransferase
MHTHPLITANWDDYQLLDAGDGQKLERFGSITMIRPDAAADFSPAWDEKKWRSMADVIFHETTNAKGSWQTINKPIAASGWDIHYQTSLQQNLHFHLKETPHKHIGIFPEQRANWDFIGRHDLSGKKALNLFAYTGGMSLATRTAGADTTHVDASKSAVTWAKDNTELSGLSGIRFIVDDALKFLKREEKRLSLYHCITMDPPAYGIGPNGERWQLEKLLPELLAQAARVLAADGLLILNTYSPTVDAATLQTLLHEFFPQRTADISQLCLQSTTGKIINTGLVSRLDNVTAT